jgi:hypothetical protein
MSTRSTEYTQYLVHVRTERRSGEGRCSKVLRFLAVGTAGAEVQRERERESEKERARGHGAIVSMGLL